MVEPDPSIDSQDERVALAAAQAVLNRGLQVEPREELPPDPPPTPPEGYVIVPARRPF